MEVFSLSEHQNIRKAVLCVLPNALLVTLQKTQGLPQKPKSDGDSDEIFEDEARHIRKVVLCVLLEEWRAVLGNIAEDPRIMI